jgi:hypothetical protein
MKSFHDIRFANEDDEYLLYRNALLEEELALGQKLEKAASLQRQLVPEALLRFKFLTPSFV